MSRIYADQIQKPSGTALNLPVAGATPGQYLQTDGQGNLSFANPTVNEPGQTWLVAPENANNIGTLVSHSDRVNTYSTGEWSSSGPYTTFNNYSVHSNNNAIQFWNMVLGDGMGAYVGTNQYMYGADTENEMPRRVQFANGNRVGYARDVFHRDNSSSDAGCSWRVLPIRNTNSGSVTVTVTGYVSNYWGSGYEGAQLAYFTPNTSKYSTVTDVTGTSVATITGSNYYIKDISGTVTIPANTTVLVVLTSTDYYWTTYRFKDTNYFTKLQDIFTGTNGVICDMRMLSNLARGRPAMAYNGNLTSLSALWTSCATAYGDR